MFKKIAGFLLCAFMLLCLGLNAFANETLSVSDYVTAPAWAESTSANESDILNLGGKSVLLIEETTGQILYEKDADVKMAPASITKIMTLLLTMEALEKGAFSLDTQVVCSQHAASMGGAQIWLEEGEKMSVDDLLKAVCIKSANDAAVLLSELVGGSEEGFVVMMNQRAKELGMKDTTFKNASGLDAEGHLSTARDIATMSRALMRHDKIFEYTKIWMDTLRGGETELVNTNKLIRFYKGATGLKTGTTDSAGSCLSATAERDGLSLIGVVMGFSDSKTRNAAASKLLNYGFANYKIETVEKSEEIPKTLPVKNAVSEEIEVKIGEIPAILMKKTDSANIEQRVNINDEIVAPIKEGEKLGKVEIILNGKVHSSYDILAAQSLEKMSFFRAFLMILQNIF